VGFDAESLHAGTSANEDVSCIGMKRALEVIIDLKEKGLIKDYAIGGAIGALRWTEPFFTYDLDIFVILQEEVVLDLSPIYEYLEKKGYSWQGQWIVIEGIPVDFVPVDEIGREAVEKAVEVDFEGLKVRVIVPEYLIALFLKAGRDKDMRKIEMLLPKADQQKLVNVLNKYGLTKDFEERFGHHEKR